MKKILFLTRLDPKKIHSWSGTNYFMLQALKKNFSVITVGPLSNRIRILYVLKRFFLSIFNIKYDIDRPILIAKDFAKQIEFKIKKLSFDAVVVSDTYLASYFKTKKPIFIFTDVCFSTYYNHYFNNSKISQKTITDGDYCEKLALQKSKKVILTSDWAINNSSKYYNINNEKFKKLPFGANILKIPKKKYLFNIINKKNFDVCNLVSIGVQWDRKGMEKAVQLTEKMNQMGQDTKLYIIGAIPPKNTELSKNIILVKFLDKNKDIEEFNKILFNSHFHVLFSKSEAFGVVNCEASAYGLYTITHDIGGIEGAIFNNKNGFRFSKDHKMDEISKHIINIFKNQKKFIKNSYSSRNIYEKKLNWNIIGKKLNNIILKNI